MEYDARIPIAVFLGPSLDLGTARSILPANYYPPVRMGDIYGLLATGVRLIVVVDGLFHTAPSVWPREILAALRAGITVIGASSMGALRAMELEPYGMIGCGTVFQWYRDQTIEGDDEVAMLHAPAEAGYHAASEPLVNLRSGLGAARDAGLISAAAVDALIAWLKELPFTERTYDGLFESPPFVTLPRDAQRALRVFLTTSCTPVKTRDAIDALHYAASLPLHHTPASHPPALSRSAVRREELMRRRALSLSGRLCRVSTLLQVVAKDRAAVQDIVIDGSRRFFLLEWMRQRDLRTPDHIGQAFRQRWQERCVDGDFTRWLAANGLTAGEFSACVAERAAEDWLLSQDPAMYGVATCDEAPVWGYLNEWAQMAGVEWPSRLSADASPGARRCAEMQWLIECTPSAFGYDWMPDVALIESLQVSGSLGRLLQTM